jgi:hypothetical protein
LDRKWTPELSKQWQEYYHNAPRLSIYSRDGEYHNEYLPILPKYKDLEPVPCGKQATANNSTGIRSNSIIIYQNSFIIFFFLIILIVVG